LEATQIILEYVRKIFSNRHFSYCKFPEDDCTCERVDITESTDLIKAGYIDSFNIVVFAVMIEKTFNTKIPEVMMTQDNFRTVKRMAELV